VAEKDDVSKSSSSEEEVQTGGAEDTGVVVEIPPLFGKYTFDDVVVHDRGLVKYINLRPVAVPHTGGRHVYTKFGKANVNIVERLINNMMRTEHFTGKKIKAYKVVKEAFEILEKRAKKNPIQVLVDAIENAAPREEVTRLKYGGINVPKAVDVSPSRRLDIALRNIATGAVKASHKNRKSIAQCLAEEILMASRGDVNSYAVAKKDETERIAASAR